MKIGRLFYQSPEGERWLLKKQIFKEEINDSMIRDRLMLEWDPRLDISGCSAVVDIQEEEDYP